MKGTPKRGRTEIDTSGAMNSANRLTEVTVRERNTRPANEKTMFVNIRLKETDHKKLGHLAIEAGITKADFCKRASLYMAEMIEAGAFSINGGNVIDRRKI